MKLTMCRSGISCRSEHIVSGSEYCTTKTQTALEDEGARRQSGTQSHTDFDLAPFTSSRDNNISKVVWACHGTSGEFPRTGIKLQKVGNGR